MKPYQLRVVIERAELDIKIAALKEFVETSAVFTTLPEFEQRRLGNQLLHMQAYSDILSDRIGAFGCNQPQGKSEPL